MNEQDLMIQLDKINALQAMGRDEMLIGADTNAHNRPWYSGFNDKRGNLLLDFVNGNQQLRYTTFIVNSRLFRVEQALVTWTRSLGPETS